jgi:hypothetical protein
MIVHVASALTGRIIGQLDPSSWEVTDPLRGNGTGTFTIPLSDERQVAKLRGWLDAPIQVAVSDDDRRQWLWSGPRSERVRADETSVTVSCTDWRGWINQCLLRPDPAIADWSGDYIRTAVDPAQAVYDLAARALDTAGAPTMVYAPVTLVGSTRDCRYRALTSIGSSMDDLAGREDSPDWWTTTLAIDARTLRPRIHAAPIRSSRRTPIRATYTPDGGNITEYDLPPLPEAPGRVWAIGDGAPPDQKYGMDEDPNLADMLLWERAIDLKSGIYLRAEAAEYAAAERASLGAAEATATVTLLADSPDVFDYTTGDRARLVIEDAWHSGAHRVDVPAARIIERTIAGGSDVATTTTLLVDLSDAEIPEAES